MDRKFSFVRIDKMKDFVRHCSDYAAKITAEKDGFVVDAKSILGLISLGDLSEVNIRYHAGDEESLMFFEQVEKILE